MSLCCLDTAQCKVSTKHLFILWKIYFTVPAQKVMTANSNIKMAGNGALLHTLKKL